ncbi:HAD family hydrolase [Tropicibacter oceani]|uniref:HAD family hydrolase n=1 Tax=Tropicibacter oceani TaxID=3058420 RepID=A0ABY8QJQ6_9RHOB|nr:HAD family hydrolase [Tropicibacter oceani]WGW04750.1 HAD family hydrolase [Tropicibacter oceani]
MRDTVQEAKRNGLVIFDCDGVLVDSEPISLAVMLDILAEADCPLTVQEGYDHLLGRSLSTISNWLHDTRGVDLTQDRLTEMRNRLYLRFRQDLRAIPGVSEAILALPWRSCVASSSQPDRIRLSLDLTGQRDLFEPNIFSATMVQRGKPAPDLFLHAARQFDVAPEDCVVIEDSPAGIQAAQAAGMQVIAFVGGSHAEPANLREKVAKLAPRAIISDMSDLPSLIQTLA